VVDLRATSSFQVVIEGVVGKSYRGDIAIDDVSFSDGCQPSSGGLVTVTAVQTTPTTVSACGDRFQ